MPEDSTENIKLLLIVEDKQEADSLQFLLNDQEVVEVNSDWGSSLSESMDMIEKGNFDALIIDEKIIQKQQDDTLSWIATQASDIPIIYLTNSQDWNELIWAVGQGVQDCLQMTELGSTALVWSIKTSILRKNFQVEMEKKQSWKQREKELRSFSELWRKAKEKAEEENEKLNDKIKELNKQIQDLEQEMKEGGIDPGIEKRYREKISGLNRDLLEHRTEKGSLKIEFERLRKKYERLDHAKLQLERKLDKQMKSKELSVSDAVEKAHEVENSRKKMLESIHGLSKYLQASFSTLDACCEDQSNSFDRIKARILDWEISSEEKVFIDNLIEGELRKTGKKLSSQIKGLNSIPEKIVKIAHQDIDLPRDDFLKKNQDLFNKAMAEKRALKKEKIELISQLETLTNQVESLTQKNRTKSKRLKELEKVKVSSSTLSFEKNELENKLTQTVVERDNFRKNVERLTEEKAGLEKEIEHLQGLLRVLDTTKSERDHVKNDLDEMINQLVSARKQVGELTREKEKLMNKLEHTKEKLRELKQTGSKGLEGTSEIFDKMFQKVQEQYVFLESELGKRKKTLEDTTEQLKRVRTENADMRKKLQSTTEQLELQGKLASQYKADMDKFLGQLSTSREEKKKLSHWKRDMSPKLLKLNVNNKALKDALEEKEKEVDQLNFELDMVKDGFEKENQDLTEQIKSKSVEIINLKNQLETTQEKYREEVQKISDYQTKLDGYTSQIHLKDKELEKLTALLRESKDAVKGEVDQLKEQLHNTKVSVKRSEREWLIEKKKLERLQRDEAENLRKANILIESLNAKLDDATCENQIMRDDEITMLLEMTARILQELPDYARKILRNSELDKYKELIMKYA